MEDGPLALSPYPLLPKKLINDIWFQKSVKRQWRSRFRFLQLGKEGVSKLLFLVIFVRFKLLHIKFNFYLS